MRFLLECVSCYGAAQLDPTEGFSKSSAATTVEETRHLVSPSSPVEDSVAAAAAAPCTLRRRSRSLSRQGTGDWKPSLHAISEDIVVAPVKARAKAPGQITRAASTATARRSGKRCAASAPSVHSRGRDDSYRSACELPLHLHLPYWHITFAMLWLQSDLRMNQQILGN